MDDYPTRSFGAAAVIGISGQYNSGAVAADQTIALTSGHGSGLIIKDNATPLGTSLISIQTSAGVKIFDVTAATPISSTQSVSTTGSPSLVTLTGAAHTTLTASAEAKDFYANLARTVQFSTGAITTQRAFLIDRPTYGFVAASTITNAATFAVVGAPVLGTNATFTNAYAIWAQAGLTQLDGGLAVTGGVGTVINTTVQNCLILQRNSGQLFKFADQGGGTIGVMTFGVTAGADQITGGTGTFIFGVNGSGAGSTLVFTPSTFRPGDDVLVKSGLSNFRWKEHWSRNFLGVAQTVTSGGAVTIDPTLGEQYKLLSNANVTSLTLSAGRPAQRFSLHFVQGNATHTWPTTIVNCRLVGGVWSKTTTLNAVDVITFIWNATDSLWDQEAPQASNIS